MPFQLTFDQEIRYKDDPTGISLPTFLSYGGKTICVSAKVDPGAAVCLFKREHGEELIVPVEQGIPQTLDSIGGPLDAFGHEVILQTGDFVFESLVYFAKYPNLPRNLLGRQGWLRKLRLAVIDYDNLLYLADYDS
jgi:hypothetical protein